MKEVMVGKFKVIIIEVKDILFKTVEITNAEYGTKTWDKAEKKATIQLIEEIVKKGKEEGYKKWALMNYEEAQKFGMDLGLNGMYAVILSP